MLFHIGAEQIGLLLLLATVAFAVFKGGQAERWGAILIFIGWVGTDIAWAVTRPTVPVTLFLTFDALLALGLLVLAVRYSSLWLGGAMILEAIQFGAHALSLTDNARIVGHSGDVYLIIINVSSYLVLLILIGGACATIQKRRRAEREKIEDRARIVKRPAWLTNATPPTADIL